MTVTALCPYLNLAGASADAIALYERALAAKVVRRVRFADVPGMAPAERGEQLVHAELRIGDARLMLSDAGGPAAAGGPVSVSVALASDAEAAAAYAALAEAGTAIMPMHDTPFGGQMGVLRDRFGVQWMVSSIPG